MDNNVFIRLKNERLRLNLGQSDVAKETDVSSKTVQRWEKEVAIPSDKLSLLANLGVDVQYVVTGRRSPLALSSEDAFMLEKILQAGPEIRNKIFMLLMGAAEIPVSTVINKDNVVNGQLVGDNNEQTNNFNNGSSADQNIQGDVKIKSKGKRSQAGFNISNNEK